MPSFSLPMVLSRPLPEMPRLPSPAMTAVPLESSGVTPLSGPSSSVTPFAPAFGEVLNGYLRKTDEAQHRADQMVESLALGEPVDVHQVMLALNEAANAMHLTMQVRGKVLEAYQELMRMAL
jgi:flagellar hook-basal body complex protein FliE